MDTQVALAIIGLVGTIATAIISGVMAYLLQRLNTESAKTVQNTEELAAKAAKAAVKVEEVKIKLVETTAHTDAKLGEIQNTANAVHTLVNSNMSQQLKISMLALRRIAELTKHPDDKAAADVAETAYHEHEAKQRTVDHVNAAAAAAAAK